MPSDLSRCFEKVREREREKFAEVKKNIPLFLENFACEFARREKMDNVTNDLSTNSRAALTTGSL